MNLVQTIITAIVVAAVAILAFLRAGEYLSLQDKLAKQAAVQGCMEISSFTNDDQKTGVTTVAPMMDVYQKCMQEKGY